MCDAEAALLREQAAELRAENARIRGELDVALKRKVLLCPSMHLAQAMEDSLGEEDGTIMRASDYPDVEYELKAGRWIKRLGAA